MNDLFISYEGAGAHLYVILRLAEDNTVWDTTLNTGAGGWSAWVDANYANYPIDLTDQGGDLYTASIPATIGISSVIRSYYYEYTTPASPVLDGDLLLLSRTTTGAGTIGTAPVGDAGFLTLGEWRKTVIDSVLTATNGSYDNDKIDRAIMAAGQIWNRETRIYAVTQNITLSNGNETVNIPATATDFLPDQWMRGEIDYYRVLKEDYVKLAMLYQNSTNSGRPLAIGFRTQTQAIVYPKPDMDYTMRMTYWPPFTAWIPGQVDDSILLNIYAKFARDVAWFGAGTLLVYGETGHGSLYAEKGWQHFNELIERVKGMQQLESADSISSADTWQ